MKEKVLRGWLSVLSAVLVSLSLHPVAWWPLVFVAVAPWLWSLIKADPRGAFRSGWTFGFCFWLAQMNWVREFVFRWTESPVLSAVPWVVCGFLGAWYFAGLGWLVQRLWTQGRWWAIPLAWAGLEVGRSYIPYLAFPWSLLASPLAAAPELIQSARVGTVYFVSAWAALANVWLAMVVHARTAPSRAHGGRLWTAGLVFAATGIGSYVAYVMQADPKGERVRIAVGQPGTDLAFGDPVTEDARVAQAIPPLYGKARVEGARLLVLPEGLVNGGAGLPPITAFLVQEEPPVLFGGTRGVSPAYQTAYKYDGEWDFADKTRLVIFGEFVPGRDVLPFLKNFNLPTGDLHPGKETKALRVAGLTVGPLICFEGLFHNLGYRQRANGAQMLAVMSIDDWYMGTAAPAQLREGTIWRAVETGLPTVRSASLGSTMAVNGRGDVLAELPIGQRDALIVDMVVGPPLPRAWVAEAVPWLLLACLFTCSLGRANPRSSGYTGIGSRHE